MLVGTGGFLGSVARYLVTLVFSPLAPGFPFATLAVNILGSFLIGLLSELAVATTLVSPEARLFLVTGICGGFTTFSAYMFESTALMKDAQFFYASIYLVGSIAGGLIALYSGTPFCKTLDIGGIMELKNVESLRVFVGEHVRFGHRPLYEEIVREARQLGMAGATVVKGVLSYGHDMHINTAKIMEFGLNLPMIVELVDTPENIEEFLPLLQKMVRDSAERVMITRESVRSGIIE